jgi:hypothetical protein
MNEEQIALATRAVACKWWKWLPGMRVLGGDRITEHTLAIEHGCLPDLTDAATLGCFLALIRAAWGNPCIAIRGWRDEDMDDLYYEVVGLDEELTADAEAEAYVLALEKAPCP